MLSFPRRKRTNMKVLVTGASGFVGSELLALLKSEKIELAALVHQSPLDYKHQKITTIKTNEIPNSSFTPDLIFHLAAEIPTNNQDLPSRSSLLCQTELSQKLIDKYPSAHFIYASSISVYGEYGPIVTEELQTSKPSLYGLAKIAGEATVKHLAKKHSIVRFPSIVGKKMKPSSFLPIVCKNAQTSGSVQFWGDGKRVQSYLHVKDAARFLLQFIQTPQTMGTFLPTWNCHTDLEVIETLATIISPLKIEQIPGQNGLHREFANSKTEQMLPFRPQSDLKQILMELLSHE